MYRCNKLSLFVSSYLTAQQLHLRNCFTTQAVEASPFCLQLKKGRKKAADRSTRLPIKTTLREKLLLVYCFIQHYSNKFDTAFIYRNNLKINSLVSNFSSLRLCQWVPNYAAYVGIMQFKKKILLIRLTCIQPPSTIL